MDCSPPGSSVHGDSPSKSTGVGLHALLQGIVPTQPGIEPRSPTPQVGSLPSEPPGEPTGIDAHMSKCCGPGYLDQGFLDTGLTLWS